MSDESQPSSGAANSRSFVEHMFKMPRFHKSLLTLALFLCGGGLTGQAMDYFTKNPQTSTQQTSTATATDAKYMVSDATTQSSEEADANRSFFVRKSPEMTKLGFTFIAGFVIGWAFRAFLKMMAMVTALGTTVLVGLSYFHVLNIDFTAAEKKYESAMAWVSDQAERAAKGVLEHIPGSASSFAGMFIGFRRK